MGWRALGRRVAWVFRREEFAEDLNDEMRLHVELRARQLEQEGIGRREAGYMALRQFGNRGAVLDRASDAWGWRAQERLAQDVRIAARMLRKAPGFTAAAVLTLAVGLGINTAVFSVVNAVMVRPLPYPEADRLIALWEELGRQEPDITKTSGAVAGNAGGAKRTTVAVANLDDYRRASSIAALAAYDRAPMNLTGSGRPERVIGEAATANFFTVLGAAPRIGRLFAPEDEREGATPVVVLAHGFWERRFGADPRILERDIQFDQRAYRVIGVLARGFRAPSEFVLKDAPEFYVPAVFSKELLASRGDHEVNVVGRLRHGAAVKTAQAELDGISAGLERAYPRTNASERAAIAPLQYDLGRGMQDALWILLAASALIVLIACVNVANLLLVRAAARRHESSVRLALGATRGRITRQFLAESLLLAAAGCVTGILLGTALLRVMAAIAPASLPQMQRVSMDWRVFAAGAAAATLCGLLFGAAPAWQAARADAADSLKSGARMTGAKAQVRWRASLTAAEVALSLILTVGAGLLVKSLVRAMGMDLGFQPERVLAMSVNLPPARYGQPEQRLEFFERLRERTEALPGVQSAAYANRLPLRGGWGTGIETDTAPGVQRNADSQAVSPGYFAALGIQLMRGRLLTPDDREGAPYVAVVNREFAHEYLGGADAIGKRLRRAKGPWMEIVGVVNDVRRAGKTGEIRPQIYLPAAQTKLYPVLLADFAVRAAGDPRNLVNAIQSEVLALDKDQPVTNVRTLEEIVSESMASRRFQAVLLATFAGVALALAVIGIFGVLSYAVSQRTGELGIRMALGASPSGIAVLVLKQAGGLIGAGVALGLAGAIGLTRYLQNLLFGVGTMDWQSYAAAVTLLGVPAVAAALVAARRAAAVDPMAALRSE